MEPDPNPARRPFDGDGAVAPSTWKAPLFDGFEGDGFAPAGGLYYRDNVEQSAGTVEFQRDVTYGSAGALKLSVRPIWNGKHHRSERAEIWEHTALRVPYNQAVWYGFSVRFADPIPQDDHRHLIAQWKREIGPGAKGDYSPFLALRLVRGRLFATVETTFPSSRRNPSVSTGTSGRTPVWLRPEKRQMRALVATDPHWEQHDARLFKAYSDRITVIDRGNGLPAPQSGWIDFAVLTRPGPDGTGHIELFANDHWVVTVRGHIGHDEPGLGSRQYFKFGPYRSATQGEWTLYYDNFRRSVRSEDVLGPTGLAALRADAAARLHASN
ncbi:heparin lyase I family protein [Rhizobium sp. ARZ01]|uniref:polysaccharide lyase n=1 Tax=Rhizobium sp. ARZ01 TaxID=2769313 RepID=UPI00177FE7E0|nr:polysaccharide lyase [Rhizobium sp. ARZ01]MBD9371518.1 heparin lyase I family protein [Rhizobium sp. ARZ01]